MSTTGTDDADVLRCLSTLDPPGTSVHAASIRNATGIPYAHAYRALVRLAATGRVEVSNDAYGRKRYSVQPPPRAASPAEHP